ncbi:MAG: hypothetical protein R3C14_01165 [Caldilineaceae bacterium]
MNDHAHYQSYLIRFQRGQEQRYWRVTLQETRSAEVMHFATEHEFMRYLVNVLQVSVTEGNSCDDGTNVLAHVHPEH